MTAAAVRPRILVGGSALFSDGGGVPRPLAKARVALERLGALGEPVVLVGRDLGGRPLPADEAERVAWVGTSLEVPRLQIAAFDESDLARPADTGTVADPATERWSALRSAWHAGTLLTTFESSVGAARRSGLHVIRIGARGPGADPTMARADYEAFDLLDAVRHLLIADTFNGQADAAAAPTMPEPGLAVVLAPASLGGPSAAAYSGVLERGQPGEG